MNPYEDIMDLERPASPRKKMSLSDRAAQFSPFAALTGFEAAVAEAGRLTETRREPSEEEIEALNRKLSYLAGHLGERRQVTLTYFLPDLRKEGGSYETERGEVLKIDTARGLLLLDGGRVIPIKDIRDLEMEEEGEEE